MKERATDLGAASKLARAATPGPWVARLATHPHDHREAFDVRTEAGKAITGWGRVIHPERDARFIAAARSLVPALIHELKVAKRLAASLASDNRKLAAALKKASGK